MASMGWRLCVLLLLVCASGCARWARNRQLDYRTVVEAPHRDPDQAAMKNSRAIRVFQHGNFPRAERLLQEALIADVTYGPAHNTLGKLYFAQANYYLAAWEFQYVIKLMPERPEPHNNLGLVYEAVDKFEEAIAAYAVAHNFQPDNPVYLGNLIRARIRLGERDVSIKYQLNELIFLDARPDWVEWARERLALEDFDEQTQDDGGDGETDPPQYESIPPPSATNKPNPFLEVLPQIPMEPPVRSADVPLLHGDSANR